MPRHRAPISVRTDRANQIPGRHSTEQPVILHWHDWCPELQPVDAVALNRDDVNCGACVYVLSNTPRTIDND